jgi:hypothetical protein
MKLFHKQQARFSAIMIKDRIKRAIKTLFYAPTKPYKKAILGTKKTTLVTNKLNYVYTLNSVL